MLDFAYSEMEQHDLAAQHHAFISGNLDAIWDSGNGKSFESAWVVVSVAEEYTLISIMGYKMQQQRLIEHAGRYYDVLDCVLRKDETAESVEFYFDITDPFSYLSKMLG